MYELYNNYLNVGADIIWKVAIYARLSREDEKDEKYKGQSESIENQINFLEPIVKKMNWVLYGIYIDDGYTGTNFDRPNFKRLIEDIERGAVNLIITKDLSRLGRDYIEVGRYIEKYFPEKGVRYIAANDNIDTFDYRNSNNDMTPFKAVFNDMYAKDISNKVRTSIITKAEAGECIKSFLPYGYKKDKNDKNNILIDEDVADNVAKIFELYMSGKTKTEVAKYLNDKEIKTPLKYKKDTTNYYNPNIEKNCTYRWNATIINKILKDRIYTGDLVQLKYKKINYKIKKTQKVPKDQWVIIKNNHPAIINKSTYETVQEMLKKQTNEWNYSGRKRHLLAGLAFCDKCGSRITYNKNHGKTFRCLCSNYKKYGNKFCSNIHLKEDELLEKVCNSLRENINEYLDMKELKYTKEPDKRDEIKKNLLKLKNKKDEINKLIANIYEDKFSGEISQDTFSILIKKYEKEKSDLEIKINEFEGNKDNNSVKQPREDFTKTMKEILCFKEINEDNKSLVFKLIDKILINDKKVIIKYKFNVSK